MQNMVSYPTLFFSPSNMQDNISKVDKQCWIISSNQITEPIGTDWFNDDYWLNQGRLLGASSGRGSAWMVKSKNNKMMLRHYYRGGIPARFIKDKYLWTGLGNTRSFSEFELLEKMITMGLPVPQPVAAQVCKMGLFYQANILIKYIPHDCTFAGLLNNDSDKSDWTLVGTTIAKFHNLGINHSDLNANNILIDNEKIYLIDFDRSKICKPRKMWQKSNMKRLKRSIDKLTIDNHIKTNQTKWHSLLDAYNKILDE